MLSVAYAKAEATITNAISTIAVSSPLIAFLFRASLGRMQSRRFKIDCPSSR